MGDKSSILCACRMSAIKYLTYSGLVAAARLRTFSVENMYLNNGAVLQMLEKGIG